MKKQTICVINLRQFATIDEIATQNADAFKDTPDIGTNFNSISDKLKGLGYDVLINQRDKAEFIPLSRLNEVVTQRDNFKVQAENLNKQLETLKNTQGISEEAQKQITGLQDVNQKLLEQLQESSVNLELMTIAADAINPKDIVPFVDKAKITVDKQGNVHGAKEEIERIKTEKPYMFKQQQNNNNNNNKAGQDNNNQSNNNSTVSMNQMIRRAAGISFGG